MILGRFVDGACMTTGNRYTYVIVEGDDLSYSEWGRDVLSLSIGSGGLCKK